MFKTKTPFLLDGELFFAILGANEQIAASGPLQDCFISATDEVGSIDVSDLDLAEDNGSVLDLVEGNVSALDLAEGNKAVVRPIFPEALAQLVLRVPVRLVVEPPYSRFVAMSLRRVHLVCQKGNKELEKILCWQAWLQQFDSIGMVLNCRRQQWVEDVRQVVHQREFVRYPYFDGV